MYNDDYDIDRVSVNENEYYQAKLYWEICHLKILLIKLSVYYYVVYNI